MIGSHSFSALAIELAGELSGPDVTFSQLSTDTRELRPGTVYLALRGERFDGNDFIGQAQSAGAIGAVVHGTLVSALPLLQVADTHEALGRIAALNRRRGQARVIALTGSQGKTTVKEMAGAILKSQAHTLVTAANLNNTIGVPLTLLKLDAEHEFAVIEMGANQAGEIAFSVAVAQPDLALITNASPAHIEGFGSLQGIVEAKGEIIDGVQAHGTVVLNADDANCGQWQQRAGHRKVVLFSRENSGGTALYYSRANTVDKEGRAAFTLVTPLGERNVTMNMLGKHNITNAIAAAAATLEVGATLDSVVAGLSSVMPVKGRLLPVAGIAGSRLIDDSYNASPGSFFAAIDVLMSHDGERYLVAGDMRELGTESAEAHRAVGDYAKRAGVERLLAVGEQCRLMTNAFGAGAEHFETQGALIECCRKLATADATFLIKGSRGSTMDIVVKAMSQSEDA